MSRRTKLDPITKARIKRQSRCPDCTSDVHIVANAHAPGAHQVAIRHDDTCPTLGRLRRAGRDRGQIGLVQLPGTSDEDFAEQLLAAAEVLAEMTGGPVALRPDLYEGLPW